MYVYNQYLCFCRDATKERGIKVIKKQILAYAIDIPDNLRKLLEKYGFLQKVEELCEEKVKADFAMYERLYNEAVSLINASWQNPENAQVNLMLLQAKADLRITESENTIHKYDPEWKSPVTEFIEEIQRVVEDFKEISRIELENLEKSRQN